MHHFTLTVIAIFYSFAGLAQSHPANKSKRLKPYKAWLYSTSTVPIGQGYLYHLTDSFVLLTYTPPLTTKKIIEPYAFSKIKRIKLLRKGRIGKGVFWGGLVGFVIGFSVGINTDSLSDLCYEWGICDQRIEKGLLWGAGYSVLGMIAGGVIGSLKIKINLGKRGNIPKSLSPYVVPF